ncbi:substrate-binding domain-containing protein [Ravibacter arvi]|uniref:Substrate-binding domain-containing protein n=1 Tax=Ravibacter arvi TaxID=2051041 RepID=A0ABP8M5J3_9BACT
MKEVPKPDNQQKNLSGVKEIAKRANVSIATVDRVIHNRSGVSAKTKAKINQIIEELNYLPNLMASRLALGKTTRLAAIIPEVTEESEFWLAPLNGLKRADKEIRQFGIEVDPFLFNPSDRESFKAIAKNIMESEYDGIILAPSFIEESKKLLDECTRKNIPFVFLDSNIPDQSNLTYIGPPYFQSGYVAANLLSRRLQPTSKLLVVNIATESDSFNYLQIENGFRKYFKEFELGCEITRIDIRETEYESVARYLTYVFMFHAEIEAVFVTNSQVSTVASFLYNSKRSHVAVIGYDYTPENIRYLRNGTIDFLICHQAEDQGYRAAMSLYQYLVLGQRVPKEYFMPIDIITKENHEYYRN